MSNENVTPMEERIFGKQAEEHEMQQQQHRKEQQSQQLRNNPGLERTIEVTKTNSLERNFRRRAIKEKSQRDDYHDGDGGGGDDDSDNVELRRVSGLSTIYFNNL